MKVRVTLEATVKQRYTVLIEVPNQQHLIGEHLESLAKLVYSTTDPSDYHDVEGSWKRIEAKAESERAGQAQMQAIVDTESSHGFRLSKVVNSRSRSVGDGSREDD